MQHGHREQGGNEWVGRPVRSSVPGSRAIGAASLVAALGVHLGAFAFVAGDAGERPAPAAPARAQATLSMMAITIEPAPHEAAPGLALPETANALPAFAAPGPVRQAPSERGAPGYTVAQLLAASIAGTGTPPAIAAANRPAPLEQANAAQRDLGIARHALTRNTASTAAPLGLQLAALGDPGFLHAGLAPERPDLTPLPRVRPADLLASAERPSLGGPPTSPLLSRARLVIHHTAMKADEAVGLAAQLVAAGGADVLTREVGFEIGHAQLRYYHPTDAALSRLVARAAGGGFELRDFTEFEPAPSYGTVEIWLPGMPG